MQNLLNLITDEEKEFVRLYLQERLVKRRRSKRRGLAIVFDITHMCNLGCRGCGIDSTRVERYPISSTFSHEVSFGEVILILHKIKEYHQKHKGLPLYLNFGGGEPLIRDDIHAILRESEKLFGSESLAIDTNGTMLSANDIIKVARHVNRIGISIDGLEEYHNWWRNPIETFENFESLLKKLNNLLSEPGMAEKIEVATVLTSKNIDQIPYLIDTLVEKGVKKYVIHRAVPVGRFTKLPNLIPSAKDYFRLLVSVAKCFKKYKNQIDIRLHHSLESIYIAFILGEDTYDENKIGEPDIDSCMGIDPLGNVYFDPWCMAKPWSRLTGGNLLMENSSLERIIDEGLLSISKAYCAREVRCLGCDRNCSGGSRITAAGEYLLKLSLPESAFTMNHLLTGLSQIDSACPFLACSRDTNK